jgi:hypothetical protein
MTMTKPVNRSLSNVVKKRLLCFSIALLLCILACVYQSISGTGTGHSFAANVPTNTVSGVVFDDVNGNGKLDTHEVGIGGVTVHLYYTDGKLAGTAITNAQGEYFFPATSNTDYQIKLDNAANYTTGPLKGHRLTIVHSDTCDDQTSDHNEHSCDIGFTFAPVSGKPVVSDNGTVSFQLCDCDCKFFGEEDTPTPCSNPELTPTPGSKPEQTPTPGSKKSTPANPKQASGKQASGKQTSASPTTYPKLPATGGDPAGHLLP